MKVFKEYTQNQAFLLPPDISEMIPEGHLVRIMNDIVEQMDLSCINVKYQGGGAPAYYPAMMLKVVVYAYLDGVYTSRKIAKALRENVNYMWLSGFQTPDFRTINNFRSGKLKEEIKKIFKQVVEIAESLGLVDMNTLYGDGTKVGVNANKNKMIWRKNVERYKKAVEEKIDELLEEIDNLNNEEDRIYGDEDLPEVGNGKCVKDEEIQRKIKDAADKINKSLAKEREISEKEKQKDEAKRRNLKKRY